MSTLKIQGIAESFDRIHLDQMDQVQLMDRVDTKFSFNIHTLIEILPQLKKDYFILDVDGVLLSEYESLYYDDKALTFFIDHHRKKINRFKVRYRKYVNSNISFLEVKHKVKGRTEKSRIPVNGIPNEMSNEERVFVNELGIEAKNLIPSLMNKFKRITLVNKNMEERLTLDIDLTFEWQDHENEIEEIVIAELKQGAQSRNSPFYSLMKKNQIRPLRLSKYCIGIINMYGEKNVKYNRFKKKLLKIKKLQKNVA